LADVRHGTLLGWYVITTSFRHETNLSLGDFPVLVNSGQ